MYTSRVIRKKTTFPKGVTPKHHQQQCMSPMPATKSTSITTQQQQRSIPRKVAGNRCGATTPLVENIRLGVPSGQDGV